MGVPERESPSRARSPDPGPLRSRGHRGKLSRRQIVRWILVASLASLLALFVYLIGIQVTRLGLVQLLLGLAITAIIAAALVAVLWYGRLLGGAEEAARASEEGFRTIAATMADGIITIDDRSRIRHVNDAARRMFGYEGDEILGRELTTLMPERLREKHLAAFRRYVATGRRTLNWEGLELVGLRKDGREVPVEVSLGEYASAGGRIFIGVVRDITERRRAERAVAESEAKFRGLIESAPDAIFVLDAQSVVRDVNPAGEALVGRARGDVLGRPLTDFMPPERATFARTYLEECVSGRWTGIHEGVFRRADRPLVEVQLTAQAIQEADAETMLVVIARDVTEQREMQRKLLETERWASMGRLASFVAHEINTPLTNISLLTASVARRVQDPDVQERLKKIGTQGRFAANITRELLRFARPGAINPIDTDLRETVQAAIEQANAFRKPGVRLRTELGDGPTRCLVDPVRIQEVVVNLVKNAYEATANGAVTVRLEDHEETFEVVVSDTGKGIPPEVRPRLFEAFVTTKKKGEGTGLGLAISRNFVVAHGGDITVSSEVGKGSTFSVILPKGVSTSRPPP